MGHLENARALVLNAEYSDDVIEYAEGAYVWDGQFSNSMTEFSAERLSETLSYQIELKGSPADESKIPLGASKYRGLPHLPKGTEWPEGLYFAAQINLSDLAEVDRSERLPKSGILYLFYNNASESRVIYFDGDTTELEIREYPDASTLEYAEYYLDDFLKPEKIDFKPYWLFYFGQGDAYDYRHLKSLFSPDLINAITAELGTGLVTWDTTCRLYGRPHYWQGEDEGMGAPTDFDENGMPIWEESDPELLLFQDELGDANIHFWIDPDAAKKGDFSGVWVGGSGT